MPWLAEAYGNVTFAFIYHHSVSGIIAPVRPQKDIKKMFLYSNIIGALFLFTEAILAWFAFSALTNDCAAEDAHFPCAVDGLYNLNFLDLPGISQVVNFYPMLNIAAVPILNITLRNNLLDVLPIKKVIRRRNCCTFLLNDHLNSVKGIWSIILSIPVIVVVLFWRNP